MKTIDNLAVEFDNDQPDHRRALIEALRADGLDVYEYHSGGGCMHVAVDLVNDKGGEDLFQIATGSAASSCDVGLMGWNENGNVQSRSWVQTATLSEAVAVFQRFWGERNYWIAQFVSGNLDC